MQDTRAGANGISAAPVVTKGPAIERCDIRELSMAKRGERELFVDLPFRLAASVNAWHPGIRKYYSDLLHPKRNPFWKGREAWFFVAIRGGRVVGRIGVLDPGYIPQRPLAATLIMPDFIDDAAVVHCLLEAVIARARERGARELIGPMNPNIHHDVGIQSSGFEHRNAVFMGYQPRYYSRHLEDAGFRTIAELQAWSLFAKDFLREGRLRILVDRVQRNASLRIRAADPSRFEAELPIFYRLYADSFADHWGFTKPSWEEFHFIAGDLRYIVRENMALIAEWDGEPVGFVLSVPDLHDIVPKTAHGRLTPGVILRTLRHWRRLELVRVMIAGVLPSHRRFGIHLPLFFRIASEIFERGFRGGEISWVMTDNRPMQKVLPLLGAHPTKTYRLYVKSLDGSH